MIRIVDNFDLRPYNTFGIESKCAQWIEYSDPSDLPRLVDYLDNSGMRRFCIGGGSNLVLTTPYFDGVMLSSSILTFEAEYVGADTVRAVVGAGITMDHICEWACQNGLWGIENLSMIPGKVGASAVQNVGAYGCEVADVIDYVDAYDTVEHKYVRLHRDELCYGYRSSLLKQPEYKGRFIVNEVAYLLSSVATPRLEYGNLSSNLSDDEKKVPMTIREAVIAIRRAKLPDPCETGSAGSFFKNPVVTPQKWEEVKRRSCQILGPSVEMPHYPAADGNVKLSAAWLIDRAGCKSMTCGGAGVWQKQPLVLINADGHATGADVVGLQQMIVAAVNDMFDVMLSPEAEMIV